MSHSKQNNIVNRMHCVFFLDLTSKFSPVMSLSEHVPGQPELE